MCFLVGVSRKLAKNPSPRASHDFTMVISDGRSLNCRGLGLAGNEIQSELVFRFLGLKWMQLKQLKFKIQSFDTPGGCLVSLFGGDFHFKPGFVKLWHCPFGCFVNCNVQWNTNLSRNTKTTEQGPVSRKSLRTGPKSQLSNCNPLVLNRWSFNVVLK